MAKEKDAVMVSLIQEMAKTGRYKRNQGKTARQVTSIAIWFVVGVTAWSLYDYLYLGSDLADALGVSAKVLAMGISGAVLGIGLWFGYRVVNWPLFADFLIAVEAEMNKVTWPTRTELKRSSIVVIVLIFALAAVLYVYDIIWDQMLALIGV
ncbi:MAG: preprotein translocase subunit SecE [Blastopirellula sp.]|nr:MAG: preprotein translocase subunit SecE [Blastopirellula sp.]